MNQIVFSADTISVGNGVSACVNLRKAPDGTLRPVGHIREVVSGKGRPCLRTENADGSESLFLISGQSLTIITDDHENCLQLPAPLMSIVAVTGGVLMMLEGNRRAFIRRHGRDWIHEPEAEKCSPLTLSAEDYSQITTPISGFAFSTTYDSRNSAMAEADVRTLSQRLVNAYSRLDSIAASEGNFIQPMLGYYRLLGSDGREIYRSCPVLLGPSIGLNGLDAIAAPLRSGSPGVADGVADFALEAIPYRVVLRLNNAAPSALLAQAAVIEISLSPQIHPVNPGAQAEVRLEIPTSGSGRLVCHLPGTSAGMESRIGLGVNAVRGLIGRLDSAFEPTAEIAVARCDLSRAGILTAVYRTEARQLAEQISALKAALRAELDGVVDVPVAASVLRSPHSFVARCAAVAGSCVMWGDIEAMPFAGHAATEFARDIELTEGRAVVVTDFADGSRTVHDFDGVGELPLSVSPVVCYPSPSATRMRIFVTGEGGNLQYLDFPLMSVPGGRYAFYIEPSLRPIHIDRGSVVHPSDLPEPNVKPIHLPGVIAVADVDNPLQLRDIFAATGNKVCSLMPAMRTSTGWNFGHSRFYLFTSDGVHSVAVNQAGKISAPTLLCSMAFDASRFGCAALPGGALLAVLERGALVRFDGGKCSTLLAEGVSAVGYSATQREVWVVVNGQLRIYAPDFRHYYNRTDVNPTSLCNFGASLYLLDADGVVHDATEELPQAVEAEWCAYCAEAGPVLSEAVEQGRPITLCAPMQTSMVRGSVIVDGCTIMAPFAGQTLLRLEVDGRIDAPLVQRFYAPRRPYLRIRLNMSLSADAVIRSFSMTVCYDR